MNYAQSFEEFARGLSTTDLALYVGVGLILWVLFKDKLSPIQTIVKNLFDKASNVVKDTVHSAESVVKPGSKEAEDLFFKLISSWKQTRDLALKSGCEDAVKVVDQMFPYLSPNGCDKEEVKS